jgi:hypothetical protein
MSAVRTCGDNGRLDHRRRPVRVSGFEQRNDGGDIKRYEFRRAAEMLTPGAAISGCSNMYR